MKLCDCEGGLGGDGLATEKWLGSLVCKVCKTIDQERVVRKPSEKKVPRKTESMEKWVYKHYNRWVVKRKINKRMVYLGFFDTKEEAVKFRNDYQANNL